MDLNYLLLMLSDGERRADELGESNMAAVLGAMKGSLADSLIHMNDPGIRGWRQDDLSAIYQSRGR